MKKGLDKLLDTLDDRDWLSKTFDEVFSKKKRPVKTVEYFYASWAGECPRLIQYIMHGKVKDDIDQQSQRRLDNGNYMHDRYGDYFESINRLEAREPAFRETLDGVFVSGRGDLIIFDNENNRVLVEMKSINDRGFKNILKSPREDHFLQWNLCSKALGISNGVILYENKDSQKLKYHFVKSDDDRYKQTINKFLEVDSCNKKGILVPRPSICINPKYCKMKGHCKENA